MSSNSEQILHDIRAEFASLLEFVTGEDAQTATVDAIERGLFRRLVALGATLLTVFLTPAGAGVFPCPCHNRHGRATALP